MTLYGAAKAPAVAKNSDGTTQSVLTDNSGGTSGGDTIAAITEDTTGGASSADFTTTQNAIATLADKINELINHMNDGRTA